METPALTSHVPFNYRYFVELAGKEGGRALDYGCGTGSAVAHGLACGLDIWGADTYQEFYANWSDAVQAGTKDRIRAIEGGRADFPDGHFDVVFSNQVLEHVTDPEAVIADMHRLLRPGGLFIAAFPVIETWYEGHIGLYFGHRFKAGSVWRRRYFEACHRLGFGLYRDAQTSAEWAKAREHVLDKACCYYPRRRMVGAIEKAFGRAVKDMAADYMRARVPPARCLSGTCDPLLRLIYHIRAGEIYQVRKTA